MILVDTGPLVALFDPRDASHPRARRILASLRSRLVTTVPVLTEAMHLLDPELRQPAAVRSLDPIGKAVHSLPMKSRISSKGQVTVPVEVRDQLGLVAGTDIEFLVRDGEAVLRKGGGGSDPVDRIYGRLKLGAPVDRLVDAMRGPRPTVGNKTGSRRRRARRS